MTCQSHPGSVHLTPRGGLLLTPSWWRETSIPTSTWDAVCLAWLVGPSAQSFTAHPSCACPRGTIGAKKRPSGGRWKSEHMHFPPREPVH